MKQENIVEYNVAIAGIKAYESLLTNKNVNITAFGRLNEKKNTTGLTPKQQTDYDKYVTRMAYSPGTDIRNDADILIHQYEEEKMRLEADINKELISKLTNELRDLLSTRKLRSVEHEFENLLAEFDIVYKQHFTMTLTGEPCHRLLINSEEILDSFREILLRGLESHVDGVPDKADEEKESLIEQIERMTVRMKDIMAVLDYIVITMREDRSHTDEECTTFKLACDYY